MLICPVSHSLVGTAIRINTDSALWITSTSLSDREKDTAVLVVISAYLVRRWRGYRKYPLVIPL